MPLPHITPDEYLAACKRRFGTANPERIHNPVWEWMVHKGHNPYVARTSLGLEYNVDGPGNPDFCFDRFGAPKVRMPDGRLITIAGEHEDSYDPDFCIYNDVIVQRDGDVEIYGYPKDVFPPTDFHTATLVGDHIYLIGSLGYHGQRRVGHTPVFRLATGTYRIEPLETGGQMPGWIHRHTAALTDDGAAIELTGGLVELNGTLGRNVDAYRLRLADGVWERLTDCSAWRQFIMTFDEDIEAMRDLGWYSGEVLASLGYPCKPFEDFSYDLNAGPADERDAPNGPPDRPHILFVDDVPVEIIDDFEQTSIIVQGVLAQPRLDHLLEQLQDAARRSRRTNVRIEELIRPAGD